MKWNIHEKKLRELPDDQEKVHFAQVTQLLEGRNTVVELKKDSKIHTETRGRPPGSQNLPNCSTKRDLSKFEHVEKAAYQKPGKCGCCGQPGHYKRTCQFRK